MGQDVVSNTYMVAHNHLYFLILGLQTLPTSAGTRHDGLTVSLHACIQNTHTETKLKNFLKTDILYFVSCSQENKNVDDYRI